MPSLLRRRHVCDLRPVAVDRQSANSLVSVTRTTFVLIRCAGCGDLETLTLNGHWTLAQVCGETGNASD